MNLCINAKDAMDGQGRLSIRLGQYTHQDYAVCASCHHSFHGEYQVLSVADSGEGMTSDVCEKIFEPFYTTKEVGKGSGMGLAMVHGILHECNAHIQVDSMPGAGTEFRLYFPLPAELASDDEVRVEEFNRQQG